MSGLTAETMVVAHLYARLIGILIGSRVRVEVSSAADAPLAQFGFGKLTALRLTAETSARSGSLLPVNAAVLSASEVALGWKAPALLLAPFWVVFARPLLLPLLLLAWARLPNNGQGMVEWDLSVDARSLNGGLWRVMLGMVLDDIGKTSLPGMLATINPDGTSNPNGRLPRSRVTGASVARGGKLVLEGQIGSGDAVLQPQPPGGPGGGGGGTLLTGPLDYTLRMGLQPGRVAPDGTVLVGYDSSWRAGMARSCLVWETPELRLSLGDGPLARLLPQLWVPVASSSCVVLPRRVQLQRALVTEAGDAVSASGQAASWM